VYFPDFAKQCEDAARDARAGMQYLLDSMESSFSAAMREHAEESAKYVAEARRMAALPESMKPLIPEIAVPQMDLTSLGVDLEGMLTQWRVTTEAFNSYMRPALEDLQRFMTELPPRTRRALLTLAKHGWYLDPEMFVNDPDRFANEFESGQGQAAEDALCRYFRDRAPEISKTLQEAVPARARLIKDAFAAHERGEYGLSIVALLAQVDGICFEVTGNHYFRRMRGGPPAPRTHAFVSQVQDAYRAAILSPLGEPLPINATEKERSGSAPGLLNRHEVMHGDSLAFDTEINSLRAISLISYTVYALRDRASDEVEGSVYSEERAADRDALSS
jgi:hypothetical protein